MSNFFHVGLDISKYKHDGYVFDETGTIIQEHFTFSNDSNGFDSFRTILKSFGPNRGIIRIGFESTGHYARNLKRFLKDHQCQYTEMNPLLTAKFRDTLNVARVKTDRVDTKTMVVIGYNPTHYAKPEYEELKFLYRERLNYVDQKAIYKVKIVNFYDKVFSELERIVGLHSAVARYLFDNYPNHKNILRANYVTLYLNLRKVARGGFYKDDLNTLIKFTTNTMGQFDNTSYFIAKVAIKHLIQIEKDIKPFEKQIDKIIKKLNPPLKDIKGIEN